MAGSVGALQGKGPREVVKSGSDQQLAELYASHAAAIRRMAFVMTGDRDEAEDLVQEAFVRLGGRLLKLRDPHRAAGYLFRTVVNLSRDHGRRLRRDEIVRSRLPIGDSLPPHDRGDRERVTAALLKLPVRQRAVLFLRYYMDLSETQTAEVLNCSRSAVKSLNHRASESFRKELREATHE